MREGGNLDLLIAALEEGVSDAERQIWAARQYSFGEYIRLGSCKPCHYRRLKVRDGSQGKGTVDNAAGQNIAAVGIDKGQYLSLLLAGERLLMVLVA